MRRTLFCWVGLAVGVHFLVRLRAWGQAPKWPGATEGDYVAKTFKFRSGETLPELRLHYTTLGKPVRNAEGRVTNAVLILHGTGGSGTQFLQPIFAGELFGPGQLLDSNRYFIILPDGIGHGKSSKPSDGLHAHFPQYEYDDMVAAHHQLLSQGLGVNHLRLILGTSMGCMHSFVWGETYSDFMDALMPLACQPVEIAGRNGIARKMVRDAIRHEPEWQGGDRRPPNKKSEKRAFRVDSHQRRNTRSRHAYASNHLEAVPGGTARKVKTLRRPPWFPFLLQSGESVLRIMIARVMP